MGKRSRRRRRQERKNSMASPIMNENRKITVIKDVLSEYPPLWMEVYVVGDEYEQRAFAEMFIRSNCTRASSPETADLVIFTGGEDVNPILYDENAHSTTRFSSKRDEEDMKIYETCLSKGIPMLGVCRGAQFLHVMNGGKLFQDINNHTGNHNMWLVQERRLLDKVSSVHHQSCVPNSEMLLLATTSRSQYRWRNPSVKEVGTGTDVEAFFYRDTCCLGVQGHPEYKGYDEFMKWTLDMINEYIVCSIDVVAEGNRWRLKKEFREERDARWAATAQKKEVA